MFKICLFLKGAPTPMNFGQKTSFKITNTEYLLFLLSNFNFMFANIFPFLRKEFSLAHSKVHLGLGLINFVHLKSDLTKLD